MNNKEVTIILIGGGGHCRSVIDVIEQQNRYEIIEKYGSGIQRIKDECKAHGVKEPSFEEFVHGFRVILYKEKLNDGVNVVEKKVFEVISKNRLMKANEIAKHFPNVTQRTIERYIKQLKDEQKIEFKGSPKNGGYVVK